MVEGASATLPIIIAYDFDRQLGRSMAFCYFLKIWHLRTNSNYIHVLIRFAKGLSSHSTRICPYITEFGHLKRKMWKFTIYKFMIPLVGSRPFDQN